MPDGAFSESDDGDVANPLDVIKLVEAYDLEIDSPSTFSEFEDDVDDAQMQQLVEEGFDFADVSGLGATRAVVGMVGVAYSTSPTRKSTHDRYIWSDLSVPARSPRCRNWACSIASSTSCLSPLLS